MKLERKIFVISAKIKFLSLLNRQEVSHEVYITLKVSSLPLRDVVGGCKAIVALVYCKRKHEFFLYNKKKNRNAFS